MWWPRLFTAHAEIAWDDYEKDYSDLPAEVSLCRRVPSCRAVDVTCSHCQGADHSAACCNLT